MASDRSGTTRRPAVVRLATLLTAVLCGAVMSCSEVTSPGAMLPLVDSLLANVPGPRAVRVQWTSPQTRGTQFDVAGFVVERRTNFGGPFAEVAVLRDQLARNWIDTDIIPETWYGYRVRVLSLRGERGPASPVQGVRTLPAPGVIATVLNEDAAEAGAPDPDGFLVRVSGAGVDSTLALGRVVRADSVRLTPLPLGTYQVRLSGIARSCDVLSDTVRTVVVTDTGTAPLSRSEFRLRCFDPTRGRIIVVVTAGGSSVDNAYRVALDGERSGTNLPDSLRLVARDVPIALSGGTGATAFSGLQAGTYRLRLQDIAANCTLTDTATRTVVAGPGTRDTVRFAVQCRGNTPGGTTLPVKVRTRFTTATAPAGAAVALDASIDTRDSSSTLNVSGYTMRVTYDNQRLRVDSVVNRNTRFPTFSANPAFAPNIVQVIGNGVGAGPTGLIDAFRIHFTVLPGATTGATTSTETRVVNLGTFNGTSTVPIVLTRIGVAEEGVLTFGAGTGGNQRPIAEANGPYSGAPGAAVALSSAGSRDPDGSIVTYAWTFGDGGTSSAANPSHTYAAAGTYTARLTVTDNGGQTATDSAVVTIASGGGGGGGGSGGTLADSGGVNGLPIGMRLRFQTASADSGSLVTAELYYDARDSSTTLGIMGATVRVRYDRNRLRFESARGGESRFGTFSANPNFVLAGDTVLSIITLAGGTSSAPRGRLAFIEFTAIGAPGSAAAAAPAVVANMSRIDPPSPTQLQVDVSRIGLSGDTLLIRGGTPPPGNLPPVAEANGPYTATAGVPLALSSAGSRDPDGTIASYLWSFGDGNTSTAANPTHSYSAAGTYTARLTVTDGAGATNTDSATVTVTAPGGGATPITWTNAFGVVTGGLVPMTATIDLRTDVPETPGTEVLQRFAVDSIVFDPTVISCQSGCVNFPAGVSRTNVDLTRVSAGVVSMSGQLASPANAGAPTIMTLRFTVVGASGRTVTTRTYLRSLLGDASTGAFEYVSRTRVVEGTFTVP